MSQTDRKKDQGAAVAEWRRACEEAGDRGAMARLRRANIPAQAWAEAETMDLYRRLGFTPEDREARIEAVGILAIVLAGVRTDTGGLLGSALGGAGETRVMHALRVRRLTAARDGAETLRGFREAAALLKGAAPVADLARCVLGWLDPATRDRTRARFLFDYHGAGFAAPHEPTDPTDDATESTP